jgi:hypothetical protein
MRFLNIIASTLAVMSGLVAAGQNPIIYPGTDAQIDAGSTIQITWNPTAGAKVTLKLMYGQTQNLQTGTTIASAIANTGSFFWQIPGNIGNGQWSIGITDGNTSDDNYSPFFIINGGSGKQGAAGSASATAAPTTAAITNSAVSAFLATATGGVSSSAMAVPTAMARAGGVGMGLAAAVGVLIL